DPWDAGINHLLEQLYSRYLSRGHDFGPKIHDGPVRRRRTPRQSSFVFHGITRHPDATLIANLPSHSGPVDAIVVAQDHTFFVTCSDDTTAKV
ncbi:hypothetical protein JB92DRAFT_2566999, partial [Gautieria morchelliformis]